jgi:hypothetical protein
MRLLDMSKKASAPPRKEGDPVAVYLCARGIPAAKFPPDMLRELTRLLADAESPSLNRPVHPDLDVRRLSNGDEEHYRAMLTFEMYLASWIAREGICDRPKSGKRRTKSPRPNSQMKKIAA